MEQKFGKLNAREIVLGSTIYAHKPGDGSAREQAASCQRVLGGAANLAREYATKRYRSNLINWGMLPFLTADADAYRVGDYVFIPHVREAVQSGAPVQACILRDGSIAGEATLTLGELTEDEKQILLDGCLINFYRSH